MHSVYRVDTPRRPQRSGNVAKNKQGACGRESGSGTARAVRVFGKGNDKWRGNIKNGGNQRVADSGKGVGVGGGE